MAKLAHFVRFVPVTKLKKKKGLIVKSWLNTRLPELLGWGKLAPSKVKNMIKVLCRKMKYKDEHFKAFIAEASVHFYPVRWSEEAIRIFNDAHKVLAPTICLLSCTRKPYGSNKAGMGAKYASMERVMASGEQQVILGMRKAAGKLIFATSVFFATSFFFSHVSLFFRLSPHHRELCIQILRAS